MAKKSPTKRQCTGEVSSSFDEDKDTKKTKVVSIVYAGGLKSICRVFILPLEELEDRGITLKKMDRFKEICGAEKTEYVEDLLTSGDESHEEDTEEQKRKRKSRTQKKRKRAENVWDAYHYLKENLSSSSESARMWRKKYRWKELYVSDSVHIVAHVVFNDIF